jgi:hypothetical protein
VNEAIAAALEEMGLAWTRRESEWVVPASARVPCEVVLGLSGDEVRVAAVLVVREEIGARETRALGHFLRRAEVSFRSVSLRLDGNKAVAEACLPAAEIDARLSDAVGGVLSAARVLSREAEAMLLPEVARAYEEFQVSESEIVAPTPRI